VQSGYSFLKWAGGKRWLVNRYPNLFPKAFKRYFEPFLGGGSVLFALQPEKGALVSDANPELINLYAVIKERPNDFLKKLRIHARRHSTDYYYAVREKIPGDPIAQAARTLYLNRTCWNGLYRVNKRGEFNVPQGTKDTVLFPEDDFCAVARSLRNVEIRCCDFELTIDAANDGDFLFVDPPYTVRHNNNGFIKYNESIFSWNDQIRLSRTLERAAARGVRILLTNANHRPVRDLYRSFGTLHTLPRQSVISGMATGRKGTTELAVQINCHG
jgi:DNA adenine methylase